MKRFVLVAFAALVLLVSCSPAPEPVEYGHWINVQNTTVSIVCWGLRSPGDPVCTTYNVQQRLCIDRIAVENDLPEVIDFYVLKSDGTKVNQRSITVSSPMTVKTLLFKQDQENSVTLVIERI